MAMLLQQLVDDVEQAMNKIVGCNYEPAITELTAVIIRFCEAITTSTSYQEEGVVTRELTNRVFRVSTHVKNHIHCGTFHLQIRVIMVLMFMYKAYYLAYAKHSPGDVLDPSNIINKTRLVSQLNNSQWRDCLERGYTTYMPQLRGFVDAINQFFDHE